MLKSLRARDWPWKISRVAAFVSSWFPKEAVRGRPKENTMLLTVAPLAYHADLGVMLPRKMLPADQAVAGPPPGHDPVVSRHADVRLLPSVAEKTEQQTAPGASITYFSSFPGDHGAEVYESYLIKTPEGSWKMQEPGQESSLFVWSGSFEPKEEELKEGGPPRGGPPVGGPIDRSRKVPMDKTMTRCGFNWDDAAAKVGPTCIKDSDCIRPKASYETWPKDAQYTCYKDLPDYERGNSGDCVTLNPMIKTDLMCQTICNGVGGWCDPNICRCVKNSKAWDISSPIQPHDDNITAADLPQKEHDLLIKVKNEYDANAAGLPACRWKPNKSCTNVTQYECFEGGDNSGKCSSESWFGKPGCTRSCVHTSLLNSTPYYAIWIPGTKFIPFKTHERQPRYQHDAKMLTPEARGIDLFKNDVLMSRFCRSSSNKVVGITLYSPRYLDKARRLLRSCERVGMCCKATKLPGDAFGPKALEGTEEFRFQVISMKPSFILSQIKATELPVVFLDTDLEFQQFPNLFLPGAWPHTKDVDVALFNFWGNETLPKTKNTVCHLELEPTTVSPPLD